MYVAQAGRTKKLKWCPQCKKYRPWDAFYSRPYRGDGRSGWCKRCSREDANERYWNDPEYRRAKSLADHKRYLRNKANGQK